MTKKFKDEYFADQKRIAELRTKIFEVIPPGEYYHVIVLALHEIESTMINEWVKAENDPRWHAKEK